MVRSERLFCQLNHSGDYENALNLSLNPMIIEPKSIFKTPSAFTAIDCSWSWFWLYIHRSECYSGHGLTGRWMIIIRN